jgi:hypothetical protein
MTDKDDHLEHRGRFQAQGNGLEESEPWAKEEPIKVSEALALLEKLKDKIPKKEYERRKREFKKAEGFVEKAGENGGVFAKLSKTFKVKGSKDERVDIEVLSGHAFVKDDDDEEE